MTQITYNKREEADHITEKSLLDGANIIHYYIFICPDSRISGQHTSISHPLF